MGKIEITPYKFRKGQTEIIQYSYRGVALSPIEMRIVDELNKLIK